MPTNKELFTSSMNSLNDVINSKAGTTGKHTIDQMTTVANSINPGKTEQTKYVTLDMSSGNQYINPDTNKTMSLVTVEKPATLIAENIKKDVTIGGVTGTYEGGGVELNIHYSSTTAPSDTSKLWVKTDTTPINVLVKNSFVGSNENISLEQLSAQLSKATTGGMAATIGKKVYFLGGGASSDSSTSYYYNKIYCYDIETDDFTELNVTLKQGVKYAGCAAVGQKIYLTGGQYYSGGVDDYYRLQIVDTETNTVDNSISMYWRIGNAMTAVGNKLYAFGGWDGANRYKDSSFTNSIRGFDTETNTTFSISATLPKNMAFAASAAIGTKIYLFGGITYNTRLNSIYCFDTVTSSLTKLNTTLPTYYFDSMSACAIGTKIYLFCGNRHTSTSTSAWSRNNNIYVFNSLNNTISTLSTITQNQGPCAAAVYGNDIYIFGGYDQVIISKFKAILNVNQNNLQITQDAASQEVTIVNTENLQMSISPKFAWIGNSNNEAEQVTISRYNGSSWVDIN